MQFARTRLNTDQGDTDGGTADSTIETEGGVRGIATGCTGRFVARTLAKQIMKAFEAECVPFQYAFSTRAGTDCGPHAQGNLRQPKHDDRHCGWCWSVRPRSTVGDVGEAPFNASGTIIGAFRPHVVCLSRHRSIQEARHVQ